MARPLISIPVHEEPDVVSDQVANALRMNPNSTVVLHLSREFRDRRFGRPVTIAESDRLLVNPGRQSTKLQGLFSIHLSNYAYARERCEFDAFVLNASNDLYVRPGAEEYATSVDAVVRAVPVATDSTWAHAPAVAKHQYLGELVDHLGLDAPRASTPEGTAYSAALMEEIATLVTTTLPYQRARKAYPDEETILPTIASRLATTTALPFVYSEVTTGVPLTIDVIDDVRTGQAVVAPKEFYGSSAEFAVYDADNLYAVKRVPRRIDDPLRAWIREL